MRICLDETFFEIMQILSSAFMAIDGFRCPIVVGNCYMPCPKVVDYDIDFIAFSYIKGLYVNILIE